MLLIDNQYFGPITEIKTLINFSSALIDISGYYQKHSFANRLFLAGSQGILDLSIPIQGGRAKKQLLKDVRIDNKSKWRIKHWRTIESCYRRSPWYEYYEPALNEFYSQDVEFLWKWNFGLLEWVLKKIGLTTTILPYFGDTTLPESIQDKTKLITPKNYTIEWEKASLPAYHQVFSEKISFLPNLSILDLLFCLGPKSMNFLIYKV